MKREWKNRIRYISYAFFLLWIIGFAYRFLSDSSSTELAIYSTLDLIIDGSLVIAIIGFLVDIFLNLRQRRMEKKGY